MSSPHGTPIPDAMSGHDQAPMLVAEIVPVSEAPTLGSWLFHCAWLIVALVVLIFAAVLSVRGESQVVLPVWNLALPELCSWRRLMGIDCPGCGLTRCFVSLAHGDVLRAWHFNPAGLLLFGAVVFQVPFRIAQLGRLATGRYEMQIPGLPYALLVVFILLIVQWIWRIVV